MSVNVPLALPKTNEGILIPAIAGTPVGKDVVGIDQGIVRFKVARIRKLSRTRVEETTGDGSPVSTFDSNQRPVTIFQLSGYMLASETPGATYAMGGDGSLANDGTWAFRANITDALHINAYVIIADDTWEWSQEDAVVRVAMTLYVTDTAEDEIEDVTLTSPETIPTP